MKYWTSIDWVFFWFIVAMVGLAVSSFAELMERVT